METALKILHKMIFKQNKEYTSFYCVNCHIFPLQVQLQRGMYMYRCAHCTHDKDCMHTTIDGADQTAFGFPHFNQDDKCTHTPVPCLYCPEIACLKQNSSVNSGLCCGVFFFPDEAIWCNNSRRGDQRFHFLGVHARWYKCHC